MKEAFLYGLIISAIAFYIGFTLGRSIREKRYFIGDREVTKQEFYEGTEGL